MSSINDSEWKKRCAALLLRMKDENGKPLIEGDHKTLTVAEICAQVQFDHVRAKGLLGPDHPSNMQPMRIPAHKRKTRDDVRRIAKAKRQAGETGKRRRRRRIPSRPFEGWRNFRGERVWRKPPKEQMTLL